MRTSRSWTRFGAGDSRRVSSGAANAKCWRKRRSWTTSAVVGLFLIALSHAACEDSGGGHASKSDNGGIGGTGISKGTVTAFGSIFVNGVRWDVSQATVTLRGTPATEADLRLGMQVKVTGDFAADGLSGTAASVVHETTIEGPIESAPVETTPGGPEKTFTILGRTITVDQLKTVFGDGATFASLAQEQVMEISGFEMADQSVTATRAALKGSFPMLSEIEFCGTVANLVKNPDGSGIFDIDAVTIRYLSTTGFSGTTRADLMNGVMVDVKGGLRASGNEVDATEVELDIDGFGISDANDAEVEGFVTDFVSLSDFRVFEIPIDGNAAVLSPPSLVIADGVVVEVEGRLVGGKLVADRIEAEDRTGGSASIEASASAVDAANRELTILGVVVAADANTSIQDERDGDQNFTFDEITIGDWLKIEGSESGVGRVVAHQIVRDVVKNDVTFRGSVTALDRNLPTMSVIDVPIPLHGLTSYEDQLDQPRTETEFFRVPGDVAIGDVVEVEDKAAVDPQALLEADEVELK